MSGGPNVRQPGWRQFVANAGPGTKIAAGYFLLTKSDLSAFHSDMARTRPTRYANPVQRGVSAGHHDPDEVTTLRILSGDPFGPDPLNGMAACKGKDPVLWDKRKPEARAICADCPVADACDYRLTEKGVTKK